MKTIKCLPLLLFLFGGSFTMQASSVDSSFLAGLLPDTLEGWRPGASDQIYTPQNLYEFIDGGAELYLSYGFQKLYHRTYVRDSHPDILVDIFDMGNAANAFGIFMHTREHVDTTFGQGSEYVQGFLNFWKGRFYVSILALAETPDSKKAVYRLASHIDAAIGRKGQIPELARKLPENGLKPASVRYFHHYIWLNSYLYLSNENLLGISEKDQVVLGKYDDGSLLIIVQYHAEARAREIYKILAEKDFPAIKNRAVVKIKNTFLLFDLYPPYLVIAASHQNVDRLKILLQNAIDKLK